MSENIADRVMVGESTVPLASCAAGKFAAAQLWPSILALGIITSPIYGFHCQNDHPLIGLSLLSSPQPQILAGSVGSPA